MNTDSDRPVVDFDQHGVQYAADWRGTLERMRRDCPVAWTEAHGGFWVISRYEDILAIERNPAVFSCDNDLRGERAHGKGIRIPSSLIRFRLNESDPPEHTELRKLETPFFSATALEKWKTLAQELVDEHIDAVIESGSVDLCHDIAIPVPAKVTLRLIGVPAADWRDYMATSLTNYLPPNHPDFPNAERARIAGQLKALLLARRDDPRDDIISALAHAQFQGNPLDLESALGMIVSLAFGGFDTTAATTLNGLYWLEQHRELHGRLVADDKFLERAVDEFLRYFPPVLGGLARTVTQDTELRGRRLRKGERVLLMFNSGNFDSERFECPEELRVERANARQNLAFGAGPHRCLGAGLGMAEVGIMIRAVLKRLPDYRIRHDLAKRVPRFGGVNAWLTMPAFFTPGRRLEHLP